MTVAVLAGVIVLSAFCEVIPHCPLPLGPPMTPRVMVLRAYAVVAEVIVGSGKTPYLPQSRRT